jgi:hypothetical protein
MFFLAGTAASSALDIISQLQNTLGNKGSSGTSSSSSSPGSISAPTSGPTFDVSAGGSSNTAVQPAAPTSPLAPSTMDALLSVQGQGQAPVVNGDAFSQQLFGLLDGNSDGAISQSEFDTAFAQNGNTTLANQLFAQIDTNHDGSISPDELTNALSNAAQAVQDFQNNGGQGLGGHHHFHGLGGMGGASSLGGGGNSNDPFSSNDPTLSNDTSKSVTNADGSTTTTITYADGSQVTMTIPAASSGSNSNGSNSNGSNPNGMSQNFLERMIQHQAQMIGAASAGQGLAINA